MFSCIRLTLISFLLLALTGARPVEEGLVAVNPAETNNLLLNKHHNWNLGSQGISFDLFSYALKGYTALCRQELVKNAEVITLIDFSKPSSAERLFVLNIKTGAVVFKTLVAHGRNSGKEYATAFSNIASSFQSSLGFYITTNTYEGKHGYSLRLKGCEKGINDNADKRAIVIHGADYVSHRFVQDNGFLGRSHGCPALPAAEAKEIIDVIKEGTCVFIYAPQKKYFSQSALLKS
ncbi:MAG TPA: murein L,D-transpeptidase catalytic domain family protein [Ferruginibacter sp.]|nr:murein L,D-transpeptidase catalytic domain family protein [Ferruginibacter sp.]HMP22343.1 murein L,D-transpeptidase catalytic domain family protein [Ferruginibacter sp.]